jgi:transcriptional regulator with XRE-family HTH domain
MPGRHNLTAAAVDAHVGARLRQRRKELDISQQRLPDASGLAYQQIGKYESGRNRISASQLWHFAGLLKAPVAYFFAGLPGTDSGETKAALDEAALTSPESARLAAAYYAITDPKQRRAVARLIRAMSSVHVLTQSTDRSPSDRNARNPQHRG